MRMMVDEARKKASYERNEKFREMIKDMVR